MAIWRKLCGHAEQLLKNPSGLPEVVAGMFDSVTSEVHIAATTAKADCEVIEGGESCKGCILRRDLLLVVRIEPSETHLHCRLCIIKESHGLTISRLTYPEGKTSQ